MALLIKAATTSGFEEASNFIFGFHTDDLTAAGILEAVGHAFFTLSIGMGAMLAYGSYLKKKTDIVRNGIVIAGLDTGIALLACMVLFPITFAIGMDPASGPGLVFKNMPVALMALPGGSVWAVTFFVLLFIAALTSAISLLEVAASYFIDDLRWSRTKATLVCGVVIAALGIPSSLSNTGGFFTGFFGETSWFDGVDWAVSNIMLPLGGLAVALFVGWRMSATIRREAFVSGSRSPAMIYGGWLFLVQWIAPAAVIVVFLLSIGLIDIGGWFSDGGAEATTTELVTPEPASADPEYFERDHHPWKPSIPSSSPSTVSFGPTGCCTQCLGVGLLFTLWSGICQYRALTHGIAVTSGKYDDPDDPGAISHFQALSAALSATVGLGNIGGVAIAIAVGGPGAVFWMWMVGIAGMALKSTEVAQSMMFRDTSDPNNPHGGPMFVVKQGFAKWGLGPLGTFIGGIFCVTLLISAVTGGNMFQAWNVGDITMEATAGSMPAWVVGLVLAGIVAMVILGGIKRIGSVAGVLVPVMCILYVITGLIVIIMNIGEIPGVFRIHLRLGLLAI